MRLLRELLSENEVLESRGNWREAKVGGISFDSRKAKSGDLFFCIKGFRDDGHRYIKDAVGKGICAAVVERFVDGVSVPQLKVENTRKAMAIVSSRFYDFPDRKLFVIAVTGTKGKTTTTFLIDSILRAAGYKTALLGTIFYRIGDNSRKALRTTPEAPEIQSMLSDAAEEGVDYAVMEVSSHSVILHRVSSMQFSDALLTNISPEHLDFHKSMENYIEAKAKILKMSGGAVIVNRDMDYFDEFEKYMNGREYLTYSLKGSGDFNFKILQFDRNGISLEIEDGSDVVRVNSRLVGKFNAYNVAAAVSMALSMKLDKDSIVEGIRGLECVPGRMEKIDTPWGWQVIIDYAHTAESYRALMSTVREFTRGKVISVFGLGGNRDPRHRPVMGRLAAEMADFVVITSDNPRWEEPSAIASAIEKGCKDAGGNYVVILDRRDAIRYAMKMASRGDVVVVSGKGHEDYVIIGDRYYHYSDRETVEAILKEMVQRQ